MLFTPLASAESIFMFTVLAWEEIQHGDSGGNVSDSSDTNGIGDNINLRWNKVTGSWKWTGCSHSSTSFRRIDLSVSFIQRDGSPGETDTGEKNKVLLNLISAELRPAQRRSSADLDCIWCYRLPLFFFLFFLTFKCILIFRAAVVWKWQISLALKKYSH